MPECVKRLPQSGDKKHGVLKNFGKVYGSQTTDHSRKRSVDGGLSSVDYSTTWAGKVLQWFVMRIFNGMKTVLVLLFSFCGFSQSNAQLSWYKMLTGKIDRSAVTLHLHKANHRFSGYYYYDSQLQPIPFIGEDTTVKGTITLLCFAGGDGTETFRFSLLENKATGTWHPDEKKEPVLFTAIEAKAPVAFTYVYTEGAVMLRPKLKQSPQATYEAAAVWPVGNTETDAYLKTVIHQAFSENSAGKGEIGSVLLQQKKAYLQEYLQEHQDVKEADLKEMPSAYTMEVSAQLMVAHQSSKLLTLALSDYAYTGGAHDNYGTTYTSINLLNHKKLTLDAILNEQGKTALSSLLEKQFKATHTLQETDSLQEGGLFENSIKPNDNFYITPKGICFNYNPYEIGPYAMGEIRIFIPISELEPYLQPGFKRLLQ